MTKANPVRVGIAVRPAVNRAGIGTVDVAAVVILDFGFLIHIHRLR